MTMPCGSWAGSTKAPRTHSVRALAPAAHTSWGVEGAVEFQVADARLGGGGRGHRRELVDRPVVGPGHRRAVDRAAGHDLPQPADADDPTRRERSLPVDYPKNFGAVDRAHPAAATAAPPCEPGAAQAGGGASAAGRGLAWTTRRRSTARVRAM